MKKGFTLIELLVIIAIIAILAVVVVITINPAELLRQTRDATRVSDMGTINKVVSLYYQDAMASPSTMFMGTSSVIYVSIPDPTAPAPAGNQCTGLNLPAPPTGYTYHCAASSTYMKVDGTGWIPINFNSYSAGSVISKLPVDPVNTTSTNLYYTYENDGVGGFKVAAFFESQKYAPLMASDGGNDPELYEKGSNLALASGRGLVGYWPMDEGVGSTTNDLSDNGNNGTWSGTPVGTSGYYSTGKVGPWAGTFNGANNTVTVTATSSLESFNSVTMCAWANLKELSGSYEGIIGKRTSSNYEYGINFNNTTFQVYTSGLSGISGFTYTLPINTWTFVCGAMSSAPTALYINGSLFGTKGSGGGIINSTNNLLIGSSFSGSEFFNGFIDDVRVYNRALSAAEIQEMYNATK